tara:strand:+ start:3484 stop:4209 length:726 start_codon:yes stop_codon:yes gene_type:complete
MPVNAYFNNFNFKGEQDLFENLVIESIAIHGVDLFYLPRSKVKYDVLYTEDYLSTYNDAIRLEAYVKSVDNFEGEGDILSKFGLEIRDQVTFIISQKRFKEEVRTHPVTSHTRPQEGDIIFFPFNSKLFEIKFVEHELPFYQFGKNQTYELRCELWEYSSEQIDTGYEDIDAIETEFSTDVRLFQINLETGDGMQTETGGMFLREDYELHDQQRSANNAYITSQESSVINFSEDNPFSEQF